MEKISHNAPDNKMACKLFTMQYIALVLYCYNLEQGENKLHFKLEANAVMYENIISMYYNGTVFYFFIWFPHNNLVTTFASCYLRQQYCFTRITVALGGIVILFKPHFKHSCFSLLF